MNHIYHITKKETWNKAVANKLYDFCTLKTDGFIHCSTSSQYLEVANRLFKGETNDLILLAINEVLVDSKIVYENLEGGKKLFPHIYGPLNLNAVIEMYNFTKDKRGDFAPLF